jgi:hypothetical protein
VPIGEESGRGSREGQLLVHTAHASITAGGQWHCDYSNMISAARPRAGEAIGVPAQLHSKKIDLFKYLCN